MFGYVCWEWCFTRGLRTRSSFTRIRGCLGRCQGIARPIVAGRAGNRVLFWHLNWILGIVGLSAEASCGRGNTTVGCSPPMGDVGVLKKERTENFAVNTVRAQSATLPPDKPRDKDRGRLGGPTITSRRTGKWPHLYTLFCWISIISTNGSGIVLSGFLQR